MSRFTQIITSCLQSMSCLYCGFRVVASSGVVLPDVQTRIWDGEGHVRRNCGLAHLFVHETKRLRDLLSAAITVAKTAEPRQPGLWPETPTRAIAGRPRHGLLGRLPEREGYAADSDHLQRRVGDRDVTARLVSLPTAAALLHVSEETVKRLVLKGLLQPVYEPGKLVVPKFREAEIMAHPRTRLEQLALPLAAKP
jgi:hypothetical protein